MSEKWEIKIVQPLMCIMPVGLISENFQSFVGSSYVSLDFLRITAFLSRYRTTDSCLSIASHPNNVSATGRIRRLIFVGLSLEYFSENFPVPISRNLALRPSISSISNQNSLITIWLYFQYLKKIDVSLVIDQGYIIFLRNRAKDFYLIQLSAKKFPKPC